MLNREISQLNHEIPKDIEQEKQNPILKVWATRKIFNKLACLSTEIYEGNISFVKSIRPEEIITKLIEYSKNYPSYQPDLIALDSETSPENKQKFITQIRNTLEIKQPFVVTLSQGIEEAKKNIDIGSNLDINASDEELISKLFQKTRSLPELIKNITKDYLEKISEYKQGFYDEYSKMLLERSETTADTDKEVQILDELYKKHNVKKVFDAGCGNGRIAEKLDNLKYEVTGVDITPKLIEEVKAKNLPKSRFMVGNLLKLPDEISADSQDAITYNWHVFCDIPGIEGKKQTLSEAHGILKDGGIITLDIPGTHQENQGVYIHDPGGKHLYLSYVPSEKEITNYLNSAGFKNIEIKKWETKSGFPKLTFIAEK